MQPGKHSVKITDFGMSQTNAGNPQAWVSFSNEAGETIVWRGGLDTTMQNGKNGKPWSPFGITLGSLKKMGYKDGETPEIIGMKLWDGVLAGALTVPGEYEIQVEKNGDYTNVKYINLPGEGGGVGKKFSTKEEMMAAFSKPSGQAKPASGSDYFDK
jgi:hypothetical protein